MPEETSYEHTRSSMAPDSGPADTSKVLLPPELYEAIIDEIDNPATLKSCAIVCKSFRHRCQHILFERICLRRPFKRMTHNLISTVNLSERFLKVIYDSPHLCKHVTALHITDNSPLSFYREERSWIRHDSSLEMILPRLDCLKELSIAGNPEGQRLNFNAWNAKLKQAIIDRCWSPSFIRLRLNHVRNFPFHILSNATGLKALDSCRSSFTQHDPQTKICRQRPQLATLNLHCTTVIQWAEFYPWLQDQEHSVDLTHTRYLTLYIDIMMVTSSPPPLSMEAVVAISWIINQCAAKMKTLDLFCPDSATSTGHYFLDLSTLPVLRSLTLHGYIWSAYGFIGSNPKHNIQWFIDTLNKIPEKNSLETIELVYRIEDSPQMPRVDLEAGVDWAGFATTILRLSSKARVELTITVYDPSGSAIQDFLEARLSSLKELVILHIQSIRETEPSI